MAISLNHEDYKDYTDNLRWRIELLLACKNDTTLRTVIKQKFHNDIVFAFNAFMWTHDPRTAQTRLPAKLPFVTYPFQDQYLQRLCKHIDGAGDLLTEKSRDMGISWMVVLTFLWYWLRPEGGNDFLIGSRKEEFVDRIGNLDTLMEKARYALYRLPAFLRPKGYLRKRCDNFMQLYNPETGSYIKGESCNPNFGSGGRYKAVLLDEFSKWTDKSYDYPAWTSLADATPCRLPVSTPLGKNNKFAELAGQGVEGSERATSKIRLHWSLHPGKNQDWYEYQRTRRTDLEVAQELDISYEGSAGKRFMKGYNPALHFSNTIKYNKEKPLEIGIDFGYHFPAVLFTQLDTYDRWLWLHCIIGRDVTLIPFFKYALEQATRWFGDNWRANWYGDPAGSQVSDKHDKSSIEQIQSEFEISVRPARQSERATRAKIIRDMLNDMIDGQPKLRVLKEDEDTSPNRMVLTQSTHFLHQGFLGGIHYDHKGDKEEYAKDGLYDHVFDAGGFIAIELFPVGYSRSAEKKEIEYLQERNQATLDSRRVIMAHHMFGRARSQRPQNVIRPLMERRFGR